jgi:hypothetical protein
MRTRNVHPVIARGLALGLLTLVTLGVLAGPAAAQSINDVRDKDRRIAVGDVAVGEGEHIDGPVVSIDGNATVKGTSDNGVLVISGEARIGSSALIKGDVLVIDGTARISGHVTDDVIVLHGRAVVLDGATVGGDVRSTNQPRVERGARVQGSVDRVDTTGTFTAFGIRILGLFWLAVTISTAVLGLLFVALLPRAAQTTSRIGRGSVTKSIGVGMLVAVGIPVVAILAALTVVGLPFGLGTFGALGILHGLGYVAGAYCFGRVLVKEPKSSIGAFFAGWAILRAAALLPGVGVLVWIAASVWGIGALTIAAWRAGRGTLEPPPEPKTPAALPPTEAPASDAPTPGTSTDEAPAEAATTWQASDADAAAEPAPSTPADSAPAPAKAATKTTKAASKTTKKA